MSHSNSIDPPCSPTEGRPAVEGRLIGHQPISGWVVSEQLASSLALMLMLASMAAASPLCQPRPWDHAHHSRHQSSLQ